MLATWIQSKKDEDGFTLIELLVVVIIIGILAAIAIPVFLNQRENAWRGAAESDARNAAISMESVFTTDRQYPATNAAVANVDGTTPIYCVARGSGTTGGAITAAPATGCPDTAIAELTVSNGVTLDYTRTGDNSYTIEATHDNLTNETILYDSAAGGLADAWTVGATTTP